MTELKQSPNIGRWALIIFLIVLVIFIIVLAQLPKPIKDVDENKEKATPVRLLTLEAQTIQDTVSLPGRLEAIKDIDLPAEQEGAVVEIAVEKGDKVSQNQVLARIDSRTWQEQVRQSAVDIREADKDVARWDELKKAGAVSLDDYDAINSRREKAEIAKRQAEVAVSQCEIRSPIDGYVDRRWLDVGEWAGKGVPAFKVVNVSKLKLLLDLPERDAQALKPGDSIPFTVAAYPGQVFTGETAFISLVSEKASSTYPVETIVENSQGFLRPGMIVTADIVRRIVENGLLVPLSIIVPKKGEHVVFVERDSRAERRVVKIAALIGENAVIGEGVTPGERVVAEGQRTLQDGMLIDIKENTERQVSDTAKQ